MVSEFFQLFKTPWEPANLASHYRVGVYSVDVDPVDADVSVIYGSTATAVAGDEHVQPGPVELRWKDHTFPVFGSVAAFSDNHESTLKTCDGKAVVCRNRSGCRVIHRVGYDLWDEIRRLLKTGQPVDYAHSPTLECHIEILKSLLLDSQVAFVEVPPRPDGYDFTCCLTHDIDFFGIRRQGVDRTLAGFLVRASVGSVADFVRGRRTGGEMVRSWRAMLSLPAVFLGLARDPWQPFNDYAEVEDARRSTFFLVPFKGRPGVAPDGSTNSHRAVAYDIGDVRNDVLAAAGRGSELGVHGIDAWHDAAAGREELDQLRVVTARDAIGVRMHWLYFTDDSPLALEEAGFDYDSTCGYNDAIGYRAGTPQVFRPLGARYLMELPMAIMDSALFYPDRMDLSREEALTRCEAVVRDARQFGGAVVVNWHCRSLAPERMWGEPYRRLLELLEQGERTWFATGSQAVAWFRWRRSIRFTTTPTSRTVTVTADAPSGPLPPGLVRVHQPTKTGSHRTVEHRLAATPVMVHV